MQEDLSLSVMAVVSTDPEAEFVAWFNRQGFMHFKPYELLVMGGRNGNPASPCYRRNTYPPKEKWENIVLTVRMLDILRDRLNAPIRITSAYRSPAYNKCIGGAGESMHMEFKALDFIAEGDSRPSDWARILRSMRDDEGFFSGGVGLYPSFVHVDTNSRTRDWWGVRSTALRRCIRKAMTLRSKLWSGVIIQGLAHRHLFGEPFDHDQR